MLGLAAFHCSIFVILFLLFNELKNCMEYSWSILYMLGNWHEGVDGFLQALVRSNQAWVRKENHKLSYQLCFWQYPSIKQVNACLK